MHKAIFTVILMLSFTLTGCIEDNGNDLEAESTIEPTGATDFDSLERRINDLVNETKELRKDNDKLGNRIIDLESDNLELSAAYDQLLQDYDNLTIEISSLQEKLDILEQQGRDDSELLAEIAVLEGKIAILEEDVKELMNDKYSLFNSLYLLRDIGPGETRFVDEGFDSRCISSCSVSTTVWGLNYRTESEIGVFRDLIFFGASSTGNPGVYPFDNLTLWVSDGTAFGTVELSSFSNPTNFVAVDNGIFFIAYDDYYGSELRFSDGTPGGTIRVTDDYGDCIGAQYEILGSTGNTVYFSQDIFSEICSGLYEGNELHRATVSQGGDISVNSLSEEDRMWIPYQNFQISGSNLFFVSNDYDAGTVGLFFSSGNNVTLIREFDDEYRFGNFATIGDIVYFGFGKMGNESLWRSDGTGEGTYRVKDFQNDSDESIYVNEIYSYGSKIYSRVIVGQYSNSSLFVSDGTEAGTHLVFDDFDLENFEFVIDERESQAYFVFEKATEFYGNDYHIYRINSTGNSFEFVFNQTIGSNEIYLSNRMYFAGSVLVDGNLYLTGKDNSLTGQELWKVDIDMGYIGLLHDIYRGEQWSGIDSITYSNGKIFFSAYNAGYGAEYWFITV